MNVSSPPPRLPLRVRRYGRYLGPDGKVALLNGYVVVSPGEEGYEIAYTIAHYRLRAHGRPMPYAVEAEHLLPRNGWQGWPDLNPF
jgi:hypothetical protein